MMPEAALLKGYSQNSVCFEKIYYLVAILFLKEYGSQGGLLGVEVQRHTLVTSQ